MRKKWTFWQWYNQIVLASTILFGRYRGSIKDRWALSSGLFRGRKQVRVGTDYE